MKILVFAKQIPDTDDVKLNPYTGNIMRGGVASKLNPLDANAVEAAVQLKERYGTAVCAISMSHTGGGCAEKGACSGLRRGISHV